MANGASLQRPANRAPATTPLVVATMNKTVLFAVIIAVLVTIILGMGLIILNVIPLGSPQEQTGGEGEQATETATTPPTYVRLDPAFTVSFSGEDDLQFLQLDLQVTTQEAEVEDAIKQHMPAIRNALVLLFSSQKATDLKSRAGKEELRQRALEEIQRVLEKSTGKAGVNDVLFTSFVMQ
jgi:flagellar FliL protein